VISVRLLSVWAQFRFFRLAQADSGPFGRNKSSPKTSSRYRLWCVSGALKRIALRPLQSRECLLYPLASLRSRQSRQIAQAAFSSASAEERGAEHAPRRARGAAPGARGSVHASGWQLLALVEEADRPANDRNRPGIEQALPVLARAHKNAQVAAQRDPLSQALPQALRDLA
jgi:hypothetical protein